MHSARVLEENILYNSDKVCHKHHFHHSWLTFTTSFSTPHFLQLCIQKKRCLANLEFMGKTKFCKATGDCYWDLLWSLQGMWRKLLLHKILVQIKSLQSVHLKQKTHSLPSWGGRLAGARVQEGRHRQLSAVAVMPQAPQTQLGLQVVQHRTFQLLRPYLLGGSNCFPHNSSCASKAVLEEKACSQHCAFRQSNHKD